MSKHMEKWILDTNAMVMGGGVGLAALEAMFNLVQTQSLLASSMVKHHDMAHIISLQTLSTTINDILETGKDTGGSGYSRSRAVSGQDALANMLAPATASEQSGVDIDMDQHITELLELLFEHLSDVLKSSKPTMLVS